MLAGAYIRHYEREPADCQQDTNMPIIICVIIKQSLALWRLLSYPVWNMMRMPVELEELDNTIYFWNFASEIIPFSSHLMSAWWWWTNFTIAAVLFMNELGERESGCLCSWCCWWTQSRRTPFLSSQHLFMISLILFHLLLLRTIAPSNHQAITIRR